ncbi:MAG: hypothetical protein Q7S21_07700 [archaeon]|nr:hypothetical protein [archaeon]
MFEENLYDLEKAVLFAMYKEVGFSLNAHIRKEAIVRHLDSNAKAKAKRAIKKLLAKGFFHKHRTDTFSFTVAGRDAVKKLVENIQLP